MAINKKLVSPADIEAQAALELPDRQTFCGAYLVKITQWIDVIDNVTLNVTKNEVTLVDVDVNDNNAAIQVCALVQAVTALSFQKLGCYVYQKN
jgi:flagellin-like hook-associated protein FlgL